MVLCLLVLSIKTVTKGASLRLFNGTVDNCFRCIFKLTFLDLKQILSSIFVQLFVLLSHVMRKPTMWFLNRSDKSTEKGYTLKILDFERRGIVLSV